MSRFVTLSDVERHVRAITGKVPALVAFPVALLHVVVDGGMSRDDEWLLRQSFPVGVFVRVFPSTADYMEDLARRIREARRRLLDG